jgi:hypothetical protein
MKTNTTFENINSVERSTRFATAIAIILFAMNSSFAGGTIAFVSLVGFATVLASLSIIGWCPFVATLNELKSVVSHLSHRGDHFHHGHHA